MMQSLASAARPSSRSVLAPHLAPLPTILAHPPWTQQIRPASHASQGSANRARRGPGPRLGLKKGASEPVVPGNIIFRQRGSIWHAGENTVRGRDHTISALEEGFVRYYRDPARHPTRKYIGVVFSQDEKLPRPADAPRRRRFGLVAIPRKEETPQDAAPRFLHGHDATGSLRGIGDENNLQTDDAATETRTNAPSTGYGAAGRPIAAVVPLIHDHSGRPPNSVLGERAYTRIMAKYKAVRPRQKRFVRFRHKLNKRNSTGLQALTQRRQAISRGRRKRKIWSGWRKS